MADQRDGTYLDRQKDRWYTLPNNPTASYAGVTSVLKGRNKEGLNKAKVNGVAEYASRNRKALAGMTQAASLALLKSEDVTLPDWKVGMRFGTATDEVLKDVFAGHPVRPQFVEGTETYPVTNDFHIWVPQHWAEFRDQHQVEIISGERTVYSHAHGYAGSFDSILLVDGKVTIVDLKTNKSGPRGDVALQNTAYARADEIIDVHTGESSPLPRIEQSAVLWMRPEGWALFPLAYDEDTWKTFYALLLVHKWNKIGEKDAIGEKLSGSIDYTRWNY